MDQESSLACDGVAFHYPDTKEPALHELTFSIPAGSKTAVLGHNGSGKSTLFLHAVGILRPQQGTVVQGGKALSYSKKSWPLCGGEWAWSSRTPSSS